MTLKDIINIFPTIGVTKINVTNSIMVKGNTFFSVVHPGFWLVGCNKQCAPKWHNIITQN